MMSLDLTSLWIVAGIALMIGEMITGGFFMVFIALGCFGAALSASLGAIQAAQAVVCAGVAILGVLALRKPAMKRMMRTIAYNTDLGKEIKIDQPIPAHKQARISYQGTSWLATNLDHEPLAAGDHVTIVGMDGNTLLVRRLN
jgi:membrane protein implicated in regulation of membrane protease activity